MTSLTKIVDKYVDYAYEQARTSPDASLYGFVENLANWLKERAEENGGIYGWKLSVREEEDSSSGVKGRFSHTTWTLNIFRASKKGPLPGHEVLAGYVDTVIHEAYHCEQRYVAAKAMAKKSIELNERNIRAKVIREIRGLRDALVHAVESAQKELNLSADVQERCAAQFNEEEAWARDWTPWFADLSVIVWSSRVTTLREHSRELRSIAGDKKKLSTVKTADKYKDVMLEVKRAKDGLEVKQGTSGSENIIAEIEQRAGDIKDKDTLAEELRQTIISRTAEVKLAHENAIRALAEFLEEANALNGEERAEKLQQLGGDGSPVADLNDIAHQIYSDVDPTEASAWSLGRKAGTEFSRKFSSQG